MDIFKLKRSPEENQPLGAEVSSKSLVEGSSDLKKTKTVIGKQKTGSSLKLPANFKNTGMKTWKHSTETSIGHLAFLLDCFVISFGPEIPQLGRYHPQSDPEEYAVGLVDDDKWSVSSDEFDYEEDDYDEDDEEMRNRDLAMEAWSSFLDRPAVRFERIGVSYKPQYKSSDTAQSCQTRNFASSSNESFYPGLTESTLGLETDMIDESSTTTPTVIDAEFPNDDVIRELSEMRLILERLLENRDLLEFYDGNGLRDILALLPDTNLGNFPIMEPSPHFPVGDWKFEQCGICLVVQWLYRRPCCQYSACTGCLQKYYAQKVEQGLVKIECCNVSCQKFVHRDEISARLDPPYKEKFHLLLVLANEDSTSKTCPRCNHVTKHDKKSRKRKGDEKSKCVICHACGMEWCFPCHAPWHENLTCRQFRKGDKLLKSWAKEKNHGQQNAQKCPKCKIYIQRTTGCDHMHCNRCKTDFCYKCGDRFRYLKFFGDHYSKLSVFGCKYRFKADRPMQRKFIRGAIFGGKVVAAPILGALALCAGALAVGVSVVALPVYGGVRLYRHCEGRQQSNILLHSGKSRRYERSGLSANDGGTCIDD